MGISWLQLLEGNNQHAIQDSQLQVNVTSISDLGVVHVLPDPMVGMGGHALVEMAGRQRQDNGTHTRQIMDTHGWGATKALTTVNLQ